MHNRLLGALNQFYNVLQMAVYTNFLLKINFNVLKIAINTQKISGGSAPGPRLSSECTIAGRPWQRLAPGRPSPWLEPALSLFGEFDAPLLRADARCCHAPSQTTRRLVRTVTRDATDGHVQAP